jgi:methionyl-tRNA synthetase
MQGYNVLYPMGYDSFGLPAENAAKKEGIHPREYTEKSIKQIMHYQKRLGLSYDWSRTIATHRPDYYKWNQYFFVRFFEKGLVYRKKAAGTIAAHGRQRSPMKVRWENAEMRDRSCRRSRTNGSSRRQHMPRNCWKTSKSWNGASAQGDAEEHGRSEGVNRFKVDGNDFPIFTKA